VTTLSDNQLQTLGLQQGFREAMAGFPSGVTIVTTEHAGSPWGFTASSFCSVSLDPPMVLVCLARSAQCRDAFQDATYWTVNIAAERHADVAMRFASRGADKFGPGGFTRQPTGPVLDDAVATLTCRAHSIQEAGDHLILLGEVMEVAASQRAPLVYHRRTFSVLAAS
jgi:flavin reductase ActVB